MQVIQGGNTFLQRQQRRTQSRRLTQLLVLGTLTSTLCLIAGAYMHYASASPYKNAWYGLMCFGFVGLAATFAYPFVWARMEGVMRAFGNIVGGGLMNLMLTLVYFVFFWPVGLLLKVTKGADPIYEWSDKPKPGMEGWISKTLPYDLPAAGDARRKQKVGFMKVMAFFAKRGHFIFIPALLVLVSLGIVLFFMQTSALAPFIYTLF